MTLRRYECPSVSVSLIIHVLSIPGPYIDPEGTDPSSSGTMRQLLHAEQIPLSTMSTWRFQAHRISIQSCDSYEKSSKESCFLWW